MFGLFASPSDAGIRHGSAYVMAGWPCQRSEESWLSACPSVRCLEWVPHAATSHSSASLECCSTSSAKGAQKRTSLLCVRIYVYIYIYIYI